MNLNKLNVDFNNLMECDPSDCYEIKNNALIHRVNGVEKVIFFGTLYQIKKKIRTLIKNKVKDDLSDLTIQINSQNERDSFWLKVAYLELKSKYKNYL